MTRHETRGAGRTQPVKDVMKLASRNVEGYRRIASREIVGHICSFFFFKKKGRSGCSVENGLREAELEAKSPAVGPQAV